MSPSLHNTTLDKPLFSTPFFAHLFFFVRRSETTETQMMDENEQVEIPREIAFLLNRAQHSHHDMFVQRLSIL